MATITQRKRADGAVSYTAQVRLKKDGELIHAEGKTFGKRAGEGPGGQARA